MSKNPNNMIATIISIIPRISKKNPDKAPPIYDVIPFIKIKIAKIGITDSGNQPINPITARISRIAQSIININTN